MDKRTLLDRAARDGEERIFLAHVLDKYEQAQNRNMPTHTGFLSPAEQRAAEELLHYAAIHTGYAFDGGCAEAERKMLFFLPEWQETPDTAEAICALRCRFHESYTLSHRDFLGSLMGMSVMREKLGDILLSDHAADILTAADIAHYLLEQWESVGRAHISIERIDLAEVSVPPKTVRELRDTVAALRLDAVAAVGFSTSRAKASELIASGRVQKNYRETVKPDAPVAEGDVISARGLGKFELAEVGRQTKKGRTAIVLRRYV